MSVYIKGMEMPKMCGICMCYNADDDGAYCFLSSDINGVSFYAKPRDCPLIPVPDHGRLIDADELITKDNKDYEAALDATTTVATKSMIMWIHEQMQSVISEAPTIIPADKEADT